MPSFILVWPKAIKMGPLIQNELPIEAINIKYKLSKKVIFLGSGIGDQSSNPGEGC